MEEILHKHPFNLNEVQTKWVKDTFAKMDEKAKIGQLFILLSGMNSNEDVGKIIEKYQPGGFMHRPLPKEKIFKMHQFIQQKSQIPAFLAADTEAGGDGLIVEGTHVGQNMQVGATNDSHYAYLQGEVIGKELRAVGGNLSFSPVVDINLEWRNPVTNLRAYADETQKVSDFSVQNVLGTQSQGAAVSVKHFPGDGIDSRDHHVVSPMNHLSLQEWDKSYGKVYRDCFKAGALTTMIGHFLAPNLVKDLNGPKEDLLHPSSWNKTIMQDLLRNHLKFNGLVLTDATLMIGMIKPPFTRAEMVPRAIENGADVFLFARNIEEDFKAMEKGYEQGILSKKRLNEAVIRILATKAKLNLFANLHLDKKNLTLVNQESHQKITKEIAQKSITLIKNETNLFPLQNIKSILLVPFLVDSQIEFGASQKPFELLVKYFEKENIKVEVKDYAKISLLETMKDIGVPLKDLKAKYDAIFYFSDYRPMSSSSNLLVKWDAMIGINSLALTSEIPSAWISLGSPYHLFDIPSIPNFINAYYSNEATIKALFDCIMGRKNFEGTSPVNHNVAYEKYKN